MEINEFIIGNWYVYNHFSDVYIFKLKSKDSSRLYFDFYVDNGIFTKDTISDSSINYIRAFRNCFVEAGLKDIVSHGLPLVDLLPENHPDRIAYNRKKKINRLLKHSF